MRPRHGERGRGAARWPCSTRERTPTTPISRSNLYKSKDKPNNNKDDDKNGYVDDTYGYNVIKGKGSGEDNEGHGTHVSGIIAAHGNNGRASPASAGRRTSFP